VLPDAKLEGKFHKTGPLIYEVVLAPLIAVVAVFVILNKLVALVVRIPLVSVRPAALIGLFRETAALILTLPGLPKVAVGFTNVIAAPEATPVVALFNVTVNVVVLVILLIVLLEAIPVPVTVIPVTNPATWAAELKVSTLLPLEVAADVAIIELVKGSTVAPSNS
jgi:hypothetical protein